MRPDESPVVPPIAPSDEPPFRTPFERHVEIVRNLLGRPRPTGDALVDAGARHVRAGLTACGVALGGFVVGGLVMSAGWQVAAVGTLLTFALVGLGVLTGSRVARGIALVQGVVFAKLGVSLLVGQLDRGALGTDASLLVMAVSMLAFSAGSVLATLTPAARAWHRARLAERADKRARSLAEWRQSSG
jgi:hypothetical protein